MKDIAQEPSVSKGFPRKFPTKYLGCVTIHRQNLRQAFYSSLRTLLRRFFDISVPTDAKCCCCPNWPLSGPFLKNRTLFGISQLSSPLFVSKFCEGLAPTFFEIFSKKIFGEVLDPYQLPNTQRLTSWTQRTSALSIFL